MANTFKYNLSTETQALRKGNFWIGTNDVPKPTDTTGFWHGITPPFSGYSIYLNKASNGPSIYVVDNESELISLTNRIGNLALTSATQSLNYYATQSDKMILNRDYEPIVTSGLTLCLDAGFTPSYQGSGTTWYDLSPQVNNGTLVSGSQYKDGPLPYFQYSGNNQNVETTVTTVELNTGLTQGNTVEQLIWGDGSQGNGNMPFSFYNIPWDIWWLGNTFAFNNGSSLLYGFTGANDLLLNKWCHVVAYFPNNWPSSSGSTKMYVNGVEKSLSFLAGTFLSRTISQSQTVGIGGGYTDGSDTFNWNGRIAMTRIYNRQLSASEVLNNYQATFPRFLGKNIITNGLVEYLDASFINSYPTSGTTWTNVSGVSGGTGTLTNGPTYSTDGGGSIVFDGADDYVDCGNILNNPTELTVNFWVKNPNNNVIITKGYRLWEIRFSDNEFGGYVGQNNGSNFWYGIANNFNILHGANLTQWNNFTYVFNYSTGNIKFYTNSIEKGSVTVPQMSSTYLPTYNLNIGRRVEFGTDLLSGSLSNVQIYSRTLSQSEIFQNYQVQFPTILGENIIMNGLIYYLDAGYRTSYPTTGTTWYDVSGVSGRTATLSNGPIYTGTSGGAIIMDGVDDKITISSATTESTGIRLGSSTSPWMVNVWIKTTAAGSDSINTFPILTNQSGGPVITLMGIAAGGVMKYSHYNGAWIVDKGTIPVNDGNWHMLTWVNLNNNTMNLYVDGVFDRNISSIYSGGGNFNPVDSIGYGWAGYLNCTIATVAIYKRSTSYSTYEVQQNFNAQKSRFGL